MALPFARGHYFAYLKKKNISLRSEHILYHLCSLEFEHLVRLW